MTRIGLVAGTLALAVAQPIAALAAPPPVPAYHPAITPLRAAARTGDRSAYGNTFKLHYDLNATPKLRAFDEPLLMFPRLLPAPGCFANSAPTNLVSPSPAYATPGAGETLGSLVDARSRNIFASKPSQATQLPSPDAGALSQNALTVQYGVAPLTCGAPSLFTPPLP